MELKVELFWAEILNLDSAETQKERLSEIRKQTKKAQKQDAELIDSYGFKVYVQYKKPDWADD